VPLFDVIPILPVLFKIKSLIIQKFLKYRYKYILNHSPPCWTEHVYSKRDKILPDCKASHLGIRKSVYWSLWKRQTWHTWKLNIKNYNSTVTDMATIGNLKFCASAWPRMKIIIIKVKFFPVLNEALIHENVKYTNGFFKIFFPPPPQQCHYMSSQTTWSPPPPPWLWQKCNRLLQLGRPVGAVTLSRWKWWWNERWIRGTRGWGLKRNFYQIPRPWSPWASSPFKEKRTW